MHTDSSSHVPARSRSLARLATVWLLAALLAASVLPAASPNPGAALGTNLAFLRPNSGEWPFVDAFKTSLPWVPGQWLGCFGCPGAGTLDLDADGWVRSLDASVPNGGQVAHALLFLDSVGRYPGGTYTVLYDGTGVLDYDGSGTLVASGPGRDEVFVDPLVSTTFAITLLSTDPNDYVRNIRVIMPGGVCSNDAFRACDTAADCTAGTCDLFVGNYATQIFHPTFLNNTRRFEVVRYSEWLETNTEEFVEYDEYTDLDSAHWPVAPAEIMGVLGDRLGADIWINVPHRASDNFIKHLAFRLRDNLPAPHKVYVEYSNEVWNPDYQQYFYATTAGCTTYADLAAGCAQDTNPGNGVACEGHPSTLWNAACETARERFTSLRSLQSWDIFEQVFGGTGRLVRVLASQSGNTVLHKNLLVNEDAYLETDALATGGYFGWPLGGDPQVAGWNLDQLFTALATQEVPDAIAAMQADADLLTRASALAGVSLVFYEGGQGLVPWGPNAGNTAVETLFENANRDPRMGDRYKQLLDGWLQVGSGGVLFNHYVNVHAYRPWITYGALEYQDQPHASSPKYQALMDFISSLP